MIFLNPSILFALTAVMIPVIIHLFNLRKVKKIEFSTLMFLKDIRKSKFKRIRIKQLILLFIRILIIASIVFAFSNPILEGYYGVESGNSQKSAVIILDDSYSMDLRDAKESVFEKSKSVCNDIISQFTESDNITFILSSRLTQKDFQLMQLPLSEIKDTLANVNTGYKVFYYSDLIALIDRINMIDKNRNYEYFIVSDFRKPNFLKADNLQSLNIKNSQLYLINSAYYPAYNISLDEVVLKSKIISSESNIRVSVKVTNHSPYSVYNKVIRLYDDEKLGQETAIDFNKSESKNVEFIFKPPKVGLTKYRFELNRDDISQDALEKDNRFYITINVPEVITVGILGEFGSDSYKYIRYALNTANTFTYDSTIGSKTIFNMSNVSIQDPGNKNDVLIINDKKSFSENERKLIKDYLSEGKGVLLFPSKDLDADSYNSFFNLMNIFSISNPVFVSPENQSKIEFKKIENNHPIFEGLFKKTSEDIKQIYELPQINMYWNILPEVNSYPLITLSDNSVFLSESNVQKGKLIFCSVSANNDMSKFPLTGLFPSILIRSLQYLAGDINENLDFPIGQTNILISNGLKKLDYYINPENKKIPFAVDFEKTGDEKKITKNYFSFPYTSNSGIPGFYTFYDSSSGRNSIAALNPDPNESNLDVIDVKDLTNYFEKFGFKNIKYIDKPENLKNEIKSLRNGLELWKYFLLLAILLIIIELFYSRRIEKS